MSSRTHTSTSERVTPLHGNPSIVPAQQARPYDRSETSASIASHASTSSTGKRPLFPDAYSGYANLLRRSSNDSFSPGPRSSTSTSFSTNQDEREGESRECGREDAGNQTEEDKKRKKTNHAHAEKDRREVANLYIRCLRTITFSQHYKDVRSRTPHKNEEAKNEILKHSLAFIMALMHRLALEYSSNVALKQENARLRQQNTALMQTGMFGSERHDDCSSYARLGQNQSGVPPTSHGDTTISSNQPQNCTTSVTGSGTRFSNGNGDHSSLRYFEECFQTPAFPTWLTEVIGDRDAIAFKQDNLLTKVVDGAKSRREPLTRELLDRALD